MFKELARTLSITGNAFTTTETVDVVIQVLAPVASVPVTVYVYVPAIVGVTVMVEGEPKVAVPPLIVPVIPEPAGAAHDSV
jgi:hypothetical protein